MRCVNQSRRKWLRDNCYLHNEQFLSRLGRLDGHSTRLAAVCSRLSLERFQSAQEALELAIGPGDCGGQSEKLVAGRQHQSQSFEYRHAKPAEARPSGRGAELVFCGQQRPLSVSVTSSRVRVWFPHKRSTLDSKLVSLIWASFSTSARESMKRPPNVAHTNAREQMLFFIPRPVSLCACGAWAELMQLASILHRTAFAHSADASCNGRRLI